MFVTVYFLNYLFQEKQNLGEQHLLILYQVQVDLLELIYMYKAIAVEELYNIIQF